MRCAAGIPGRQRGSWAGVSKSKPLSWPATAAAGPSASPPRTWTWGEYLRPKSGVYAVRAGRDEGKATVWHDGVANVGNRPTVGGGIVNLEVFLFDFSGDLYDRHLRVELVDFIRPEKKFDGLDQLKAQIARDCDAARSILAGV